MALILLYILLHVFLHQTAKSSFPKTLNITAISATNDASIIECWQLAAPFVTSSTAGVSGAAFAQLGEAGNTSYAIIPARFQGGLHNAPVVQYVAFLSGVAHVTLPDSPVAAVIHGGRNGLIIAADTSNVSKKGHNTDYPSGQETTAIQIPIQGGVVPEHAVLHAGPCEKEEKEG